MLKEFISKKFAKGLHAIFTDDLLGVYWIGSAALGDFQEGKSDLDFVVLVRRPPQPAQRAEVLALHRSIRAARMEGLYVMPEQLGTDKPVWTYYHGKLAWGLEGVNPVTWYTLAQRGVAVYGPPPKAWKLEAPRKALLDYERRNLDAYWRPYIRRLHGVRRSMALTHGCVEWAALGIARIYYTLREGDVVSKRAAGKYALTQFPEHAPLLEQALALRAGRRPTPMTRIKRRRLLYRFMDAALEACQKEAGT